MLARRVTTLGALALLLAGGGAIARAQAPREQLFAPPGAGRPDSAVRLPAEFERQEGLLLPSHELIDHFPELLVEVAARAQPRVAVCVLAASREERLRVRELLAEAPTPLDRVEVVLAPHQTMWARDYGPIFVFGPEGRRIVDAEYVSFGRPLDDGVPRAVASAWGDAASPAACGLEGGNLLSNGAGLVLTTTTLFAANQQRDRTPEEVQQTLTEAFGAQRLAVLEPLAGESTGHVDMFAAFAAPDLVLVGAYDPFVDPDNAALLDRNARRLEGLPTSAGPLRVWRIPMPDNRDGLWRSYTNVLFVNGLLLAPRYPEVDRVTERRAAEVWRAALPQWDMAGIDCSGLIRSGGALHCISVNVPAEAAPSTARREPEASAAGGVAARAGLRRRSRR